jgi:hypothetical protein
MRWVDKMQDASETRANKNGINQKRKKMKNDKPVATRQRHASQSH